MKIMDRHAGGSDQWISSSGSTYLKIIDGVRVVDGIAYVVLCAVVSYTYYIVL